MESTSQDEHVDRILHFERDWARRDLPQDGKMHLLYDRMNRHELGGLRRRPVRHKSDPLPQHHDGENVPDSLPGDGENVAEQFYLYPDTDNRENEPLTGLPTGEKDSSKDSEVDNDRQQPRGCCARFVRSYGMPIARILLTIGTFVGVYLQGYFWIL